MDVTLPDGTTIKDVPDGTTKTQLVEKLKANGVNVPAEWDMPRGPGAPASAVARSPVASPQMPSKFSIAMQAAGMADPAKTGVAETALSTVTGAGANALGLLSKYGRGWGWLAADPEGAEKTKQDIQSALTYQPRTQTGQDLSEGLSYVPAKIMGAVRKQPGGEYAGDFLEAVALAEGVRTPLARLEAPKSIPRPKPVPTKEALKTASTEAYKRSEKIGAVISDDAFQGAKRSISEMLEKEGLDATLHPDTTAALKRITGTDGAITLEKLETLRKIANDAQSSIKPADKRLAAKTVQALDDFAENLTPEQLNAGTPEAATAVKEARGLWSRARKAEDLDELMRRAELSAPNFSASGMENAIRTEFRALAKNKEKFRRFTPEEQAAISKVAKGGPVENGLRMLGKLAPTGVVSGGLSTGLGFLLGGPGGAAALPAAGVAARYGASKMTMRNAAAANELVRRGPIRDEIAKAMK